MKSADQILEAAQRQTDHSFTDEVELFKPEESELEELRRKLADERDARLRLAAEFDNYRRRSREENARAGEAGKRELLERLVTIADDLELALENLDETASDAVAEGLRMISRRFYEMLRANNVVAFESAGERFDPERHEAFDVVRGAENEPGTVYKQIRRGYFWNEKLLRPALVVVVQ